MHALAAGETFCSECGRPYGSVETEPFALKPRAKGSVSTLP